MSTLSRFQLREALRLATSARRRGKQCLHNHAAYERVFYGRMNDIDPDVLMLARALVDTGFTSMAELEQWDESV
jgi:ferredoxin-fold anticodon binding domain-containing protein